MEVEINLKHNTVIEVFQLSGQHTHEAMWQSRSLQRDLGPRRLKSSHQCCEKERQTHACLCRRSKMNVKDLWLQKWISFGHVSWRYQEAEQDAAFSSCSCRTKPISFWLSDPPSLTCQDCHFNKSDPHERYTSEQNNIVCLLAETLKQKAGLYKD